MAELVGNNKAVQPMIDYSQATKIGRREGANERSREWESRVNTEGEEKLDER